MSEHKIQCPVCNQEFPQYDQRGFRNAGFTAHHKWCVGRQQQNEVQQQDQQSTRASRFAMAIRRRLLPASQAHAPANEGASKISPMPIFPGSSSTSVNSDPSGASRTEPSTPPFDRSTPTLLQHQHFQQQHQQQHQHPRQPILRQRHTWNHWNIPRIVPRRISVNAMGPPSGMVPSTSAPTPPTFQNLQMDSSPHALDPDPHHVSSSTSSTTTTTTYSLLKPPSVTADSTAWSASQATLPLLSSPPISSPMVINSSTPFSFASMMTTLPLAYSRNAEINNVNTSYIDAGGIQSPPLCPTDQYASNDLTSGYLSTDHTTPMQQQQYYGHRSPPSYQQQTDGHDYPNMPPFIADNLALPQAPDSFFHQQQQGQELNTASEPGSGTAAMTTMDMPITSPSSSTSSTFLPSDLDNYQPNVLYCGYCQPRNGFHDPSCSLLQFFLTNIMDGNENTFSSI